MSSKRSHEGYLMIDNRGTQGVPADLMVAAGLAPEAGNGLYETPTYTCSHCCVVVMMNPLRSRERAYCPGCDHYICDGCGVRRAAMGGQCKTFQQLIDEVQELASRNLPVDSAIILAT